MRGNLRTRWHDLVRIGRRRHVQMRAWVSPGARGVIFPARIGAPGAYLRLRRLQISDDTPQGWHARRRVKEKEKNLKDALRDIGLRSAKAPV